MERWANWLRGCRWANRVEDFCRESDDAVTEVSKRFFPRFLSKSYGVDGQAEVESLLWAKRVKGLLKNISVHKLVPRNLFREAKLVAKLVARGALGRGLP